jgi:hypothetical protein
MYSRTWYPLLKLQKKTIRKFEEEAAAAKN